jgi:undecaprenyl-diphosphatase
MLVALGHRRSSPHGRSAMDDVVEPDVTEHWLVARVASWPRLRAAVAAGDRRIIGGAAVACCFAVLFLAALFVGAVFDMIDGRSGFSRWDDSVAQWGSEHASTASVEFLRQVTNLGGTWLLLTLMVAIGVVDWWRRGRASALPFLLTVAVGVSLINNGLKLLVMRERPPGEHLVGSAGSSFPSGHSAAAAACWLALALVIGRWVSPRVRPYLAVIAVMIASTVAASRAMLGVHWLTDVIAGVVVGWAWCIVVAIAFGGRHQRLGEPAEEVAEVDRQVAIDNAGDNSAGDDAGRLTRSGSST